MQFSLVWLTQTAHKIQAVSTEPLILCVCVYICVEMYHFYQTVKDFQLPGLKIEMGVDDVKRFM